MRVKGTTNIGDYFNKQAEFILADVFEHFSVLRGFDDEFEGLKGDNINWAVHGVVDFDITEEQN